MWVLTAAPVFFTILRVLFLQDSAETSPVDYEIDIEALPGLVDQSLSVMTRRVELSTREYEEANKMSTPPGELIWQTLTSEQWQRTEMPFTYNESYIPPHLTCVLFIDLFN